MQDININAYVKSVEPLDDGTTNVVLSIKGFGSMKAIEELELDKRYYIQFLDDTSKRTIAQNRLLWALIGSIAKATGNEKEDVYISLLKQCNISSVVLGWKPELTEVMRNHFRAIKFLYSTIDNDNVIDWYECYKGSSLMSKKEIDELLENAKRLASEYDIYIVEREL